MATYRIGPKGVSEGLVMRANITKRVVQSLEPEQKVFEVVDTEFAEHILRVQSGLSNYYIS